MKRIIFFLLVVSFPATIISGTDEEEERQRHQRNIEFYSNHAELGAIFGQILKNHIGEIKKSGLYTLEIYNKKMKVLTAIKKGIKETNKYKEKANKLKISFNKKYGKTYKIAKPPQAKVNKPKRERQHSHAPRMLAQERMKLFNKEKNSNKNTESNQPGSKGFLKKFISKLKKKIQLSKKRREKRKIEKLYNLKKGKKTLFKKESFIKNLLIYLTTFFPRSEKNKN